MEDLVPTAVYSLCALTSLVCTILLLRGYRQNRQRLQLLIAICFGGLTINNILLPIDKVLFATEIDLSVVRSGVGLAAMAALLVVLIWEAR
ncbi:MAG TPA: DUF5985 family protein [Kofleriaceae bacterium]|nr:DUF5985 family protein [Kofleriaceae bacterium]